LRSSMRAFIRRVSMGENGGNKGVWLFQESLTGRQKDPSR
jgi:hypothetical protein